MNSQVKEPEKFARDVAWRAIAQIAFMLTGLILLPALAKNYSSEIYGVWTLTVVSMGLISLFLSMQLEFAYVRFSAAEEDKERQRRILGAMLYPIVFFSLLLFLVSILLRQGLAVIIFASPGYSVFILLIFFWASIRAVIAFLLSYFRARRQMRKRTIIEIAFYLIQVVIIVALAPLGFALQWLILGIMGAEVVFMAVIFVMVVREIGFPAPSFQKLKDYLLFSAPLIPSATLLWVVSFCDRYFITHFLDISQAGIYAASWSIGNIVLLFYAPIAFVLLPTVAIFWERNELLKVKSYLEHSMKMFLLLGIPASVGLYFISQPLLSLLATSEYKAGASLVLLIALGILLRGVYHINLNVILLTKKTGWMLPLLVLGAFANAGINIVLIPRIGITGAAISTIVCFFMLSAIFTIWARKVIGYEMDFKFLAKVILATLLMATVLWFVGANSALGIVLAILAGTATFALLIIVLKALSREERALIRTILSRAKSI